MATPTAPTKTTTAPATTKQAALRRIDEIAAQAMTVFGKANSLEEELQVAQAMTDLRAALTAEVMTPIMALMNTNIGFKTDRDPNKPIKGEFPKPYSVEVVKEVFIEARLRGFHVVGNEFNIISSGFYAAKNGLQRKVTTYPGLTDFKAAIGVPKLQGGGAVVPCKATWIKDGVPDSLECEIPVKFYDGQGADLIIGKSQRKLLARVHDRLTGTNTPEGDPSDDMPMLPPAQPSAPLFPCQPAQSAPQQPPTPPVPLSEQPQAAPAPASSANVAKQKALSALSAKLFENNISADQVLVWLKEKGDAHPEATTIEEVPTSKLIGLTSNFDSVKEEISQIMM